MKLTMNALLKQLLIAIAGISVVGATVATGTVSASNLISNVTQKGHEVAQVEVQENNGVNAIGEITGATGSVGISNTTRSGITATSGATGTKGPTGSTGIRRGIGDDADETKNEKEHDEKKDGMVRVLESAKVELKLHED